VAVVYLFVITSSGMDNWILGVMRLISSMGKFRKFQDCHLFRKNYSPTWIFKFCEGSRVF